MLGTTIPCALLSDQELTQRLESIASRERHAVVDLLDHLAEYDSRRLYLDRGFQSLFVYCMQKLRYSEPVAYRRIHAARLLRTYPVIGALLAGGDLHLEGLTLLGPHLTESDHTALLDQARGKSKREIERLVATLHPALPPPDRIRWLRPPATAPESSAAGDLLAQADSPSLPIGGAAAHADSGVCLPKWVRLDFSAREVFWRKVERARALLWHKYPMGRLEDIFERALDDLLDKRDPERRLQRREVALAGGGARPAAKAGRRDRRIPAQLRDAVWLRDGGRCTFEAADSTRCAAVAGLEIDHVVPWALGGPSDDPANLRLACAAHNRLLARRVFGEAAVQSKRGRASDVGQ